MMLDSQLREDSGYSWVMAQLDPASPFGRTLAREPRWYGPGEEAELEREFNRISALLGVLRDSPDHAEAVLHVLSEFHDMRNSFHRASNVPMDEVELFEVKHFLLCLERLAAQCAALPDLDGLTVTPITDMLDLLDPSGRRLPPFSVENAFEPSLERIREEKNRVELELRNADESRRDALMKERRALVEAEDKAEFAARQRLTTALMRERDRFFAAMDAISRLDLTLSKARLSRKYGCVRPVPAEDQTICAEELVQPLVAAHLEERNRSFTPVSLTLEQGATVITGANMGGKSVSLKSITLNLLLMQTGFFVFARSLRAPLFHSVALICADGQSAEQGLSSFGAEITTLNNILASQHEGFFFLALDEFARGTNPHEGAALARALTEYLNTLNCVAILTTHYDGVSDTARRHYQVAGLSVPAGGILTGNALEKLPDLMDYRLIPAPPGAPCPHDAMRVCRLLGLDGNLMKIFEDSTKNS